MRPMLTIAMMAWALAIGGAAGAQETPQPSLTVTGEGRVEQVPDMATITMGVAHQAPSAAEAMARTSEATRAMLDQLAEAGIEPRDMQTRDLSLSPVWDHSKDQPPRVVGYSASNTVMVRVRQLDDLGGILDAVVTNGANRFHGLSFGLQDPGPARDAARREAVAEAMRKAQLYAEAAGVTLGPLLSLSEAGSAAPRPVAMERMSMANSAPIAAGELTIAAQVNLVFAIGAP